jgi:transcriptional regulator with XRE-family HTH domain
VKKLGGVVTADEDMPSFGHLLEGLFDRRRKPNGRPYSNEEVAAAIRSTGVDISQNYIWCLRKGTRDDPRGSHIKALAQFFDVPAGYFLDHEIYRSIVDEPEPIPMPRARPVVKPQLMLRQLEAMSPESMQLLTDMADRLMQLEDPEADS